MKRLLFFLSASLLTASLRAQTDDATTLAEVEVAASRVVVKADGRLIMPSRELLESAHNAYNVLARLGLMDLKVDEMARSVTARRNNGSVELRIDGIAATADDLLAIDPKRIKSVEYIDAPSLRYDPSTAYVVVFHLRRSDAGEELGVDLSHAATTREGSGEAYAKMNRGKTQWSLAASGSYSHATGSRQQEDASYLMADGTTRHMTRTDLSSVTRRRREGLSAKVNVADSSRFTLQAALSMAWSQTPRDERHYLLGEASAVTMASTLKTSHDLSPTIDLYFDRQLGAAHHLTTTLTASHIATATSQWQHEGTPYAYTMDGSTWFAGGELLHEWHTPRAVLASGLRLYYNHSRNAYTLDAAATPRTTTLSTYLFGEARGRRGALSYVAGMGASRYHYAQGAHSYHFWLARPKLTLSYRLAPQWQLRYTGELSEHVSRIAMVSDMRVRRNSMEWTVGNPDLKAAARWEQQLLLSFNRPRLSTSIDAMWRVNRHPNMAHYERTDQGEFVYSQRNQGHINMTSLTSSTRWDIVDGRLTASLHLATYHFINAADDYRHTYRFLYASGSLEVYLGRWTLSAWADNGWRFMEGETKGHDYPSPMLAAGYQWGQWQLWVMWQSPFEAHPTRHATELRNALVGKHTSVRSADMGNYVAISLAWRLARGRSQRADPQRRSTQRADTGIM